MGIITFNGVSSKDIGLEVETFPSYQIPERSYKSITIPGRDGDVLVDTGSFKNTTRSYKVSMATYNLTSYYERMNKVVEWLHSSSGYARLEDSYEPGVYRMAYFKDSLSIENLFDEAGRATINFTCKPQRFLKEGETPIRLETAGQFLVNKTHFTAKPFLRILKDPRKWCDIDFCTATPKTEIDREHPERSHNMEVKYKISIMPSDETTSEHSLIEIDLDCELQEATCPNPNGTTSFRNMNPYIKFNGGTSGECPKLEPGYTEVNFTIIEDGVPKVRLVEVTPRWYTV